jgi:L-asparaginase / beta-aspartyl-peptidase
MAPVRAQDKNFRLVIHGGAGIIKPASMTSEDLEGCRRALDLAVQTGHKILSSGGTSIDAVRAAVRVLEDSPYFNAGRGAVLNADGKAELDAAIMDGATLKAGAVAAVTGVKNPVEGAFLVMTQSPHVLLTGPGADSFAQAKGLETVDPAYFRTERRVRDLEKARERERGDRSELQTSEKYGTVGAVALDQAGNLAAATSTGGLTNKRSGRIGDSPIIGAGTYANNATCAVSATGQGEIFIRAVAAHELHALMKYRGASIQEATHEVLAEVKRLGGQGGLIAIDRAGNFAMPFTTEGMYRGTIDAAGRATVQIE